MKVKVVKSVDPRNPEVIKYRLAPFYAYKVTLDDMSENISRSSSVNRADVAAVLDVLKHELVTYVAKGGIVEFDGLGSFRLSLSSAVRDTPKETSIKDIRNRNVRFRLDKGLQRQIDETKFVKVPYGEDPATTDDELDEDDNE